MASVSVISDTRRMIDNMMQSLNYVVALVLAIAAGYLITGAFTVWVVLVGFALACLAEMSIHIAMRVGEGGGCCGFGKFSRSKGPGLYFTIPFIRADCLKADQRIMVTGFRAEETLTSDLVPINVDAVLFWMVWDAEKACLEVENYYNSVSLVAQTALRDAIGRASVSEVAIRRNQLDQEMEAAWRRQRNLREQRTYEWEIRQTEFLISIFKNRPPIIEQFDEELFCLIIEQITVYPEKRLEFQLKNGLKAWKETK